MKKPRAAKAAPAPVAEERTVTSLALPTALWTQLKVRSAHERRSLRDLCEEALQAHLKQPMRARS